MPLTIGQISDPNVEQIVPGVLGQGWPLFLLALTIADQISAPLDWVLPTTFPCRIVDGKVVKTAGNTGANANTLQVQTGGGAAVSDVIPMTGVTDTSVVRLLGIDDANHEFAAGATVRINHVKAGGNAACIVYLLCARN